MILSINARTTLLITGIVVVIAVITTISMSIFVRAELIHETEDRGIGIASALSETILKNIVEGDRIATFRVLSRAKRRDDAIVFAFVRDFSGRVFAHTFTKEVPESLAGLKLPPPNDAGITKLTYSTDVGSVMQIGYTLVSGTPGRLIVGYRLSHVESHVRELQAVITVISALSMVLGLLLSTYLSRRVTAPLTELTKLTNGYGKGDGVSRDDIENLPMATTETRDLAAAFGQMIAFREQEMEARLEAESAREVSIENLRRAQSIAGLGSWSWNIATGTIEWSDEMFKIFKKDREHFVPSYEAVLDMMHPDDVSIVQAAINQTFATGRDYDIEYRIVIDKDTKKVVHGQATLIRDEETRPEYLTGTLLDITRAKASEQEIRDLNQSLELRVELRTAQLRNEVSNRKREQEAREASEGQMRAILDTAADAIVTIDDHGAIQSFNRAAESIFQYTATDVIGENVSMLMPDEFAVHHDGYLAKYNETREAQIIGVTRELIGKRCDGHQFPMELSVSETRSAEHVTFTGIVRDISARKLAQDELRQTVKALRETQDTLVESEKMASLGGLVAGVAHEINTPVGVGMTASSHLSDSTESFLKLYREGGMTRGDLETFLQVTDESSRIIVSNLHRAADLIRSFKQVAVDQSDDAIRRIDLKEYIEEVMLSLRPKFKKGDIKVQVDVPPDILLETQPGAISQVLTNLVVNSLTHGFDEGAEGTISIVARTSDDKITLTYQDDGKGMSEDIRARIFEPFFTTARGTGGSGLGLHLLYNLVSQSLRGRVTCISAPNEGARFEIEFPLEFVAVSENKPAPV